MPFNLTPEIALAIAVASVIVGVLLTYLLAHAQGVRALNRQQQEADQALAIAREKMAALEASGHGLKSESTRVQQQLAVREQQLEEARENATQLRTQLAGLKAELDSQREVSDEKIQLLQDAKKQLTTEFENLANRIFDDKAQRFNLNSQQSLAGTLNPLREQLTEFKKKVEEVYEKEARERTTLAAELGQLKALNQQMSVDAHNLTRALKGNNKVQGNWGEVILERVLEGSGLTQGREYETQKSLHSIDGARRQPDVIVHLPEQRDIVIDAKVSLVDYEHYCSAEDDTERRDALKRHAASVKEHIKGLSLKAYEDLPGIRTLDFVFIFIPIEAAFLAAFEQDQTMFSDAYDKNVIVVSPTTLLATLRTVQSIWRYENQNKNAEEIARQAGAMHDKFVGFLNDMEDISKHLQRATQSSDDAVKKLSSGRGNLIGSVQKLALLGAKAKKTLPSHLLDDDESELIGSDGDPLG